MPVITLEAPVGGINAFASPENLAPEEAVALDNWICRAGYLESRPPFEKFIDSSGGLNAYMMVYHGVEGDQLLALTSSGTIYEISSGVETSVGTGTSQYQLTFSFEINGKLIIGTGGYKEKAYDGTSFTDLDYTGSSPAIDATGAFTHGCSFKGRAIYINEGNNNGSLDPVNSFWYAEAGSYQGNITEFPLDTIARFGGTPKCVGVWTMDTGTGPDDTLVIYYTTGEILLYQGDDPGDADNWALIGSFKVGKPQSKHAIVNYGPDVILLTQTGYVNLSDAMRSDQSTDYPAFSRRIWPQIADIVNAENNASGNAWGLNNRAYVWGDGLILFTVDLSSYIGEFPTRYIYCLNVSTGAWSRWVGLSPSANFVEFGNALYFCQSATNDIMMSSSYDTATETITCSALPAFTDMGIADKKKHLTAVQFSCNIPTPRSIQATGYSDFNLEGSLPTVTAYAGGSPPSEGVGTFPNVRKAMKHTTYKGWQNIHAYGYNVSMAVQMATNDRTLYWRQTQYRFRTGQ